MRKQDLQVGEEYAVGQTSRRGDDWNLVRAELVERDGERTVETGYRGERIQRGIVVRFPDGARYPYNVEPGEEKVLDNARHFVKPWAEYAPAKAEHDRKMAAREAERIRRLEVTLKAEVRLHQLGVKDGYVRRHEEFVVSADTMAQIVGMISDASS